MSEESAREKVREEAAVEVAAVEVAAGAEEAQEHVDALDHDEEAMAAEQVLVDTQVGDRDQEDEIGESTTDRTELDEVTRRQEGGETLPVPLTTRAGVDGSELDEMPETVAVEREQVELPDYEEGVGENDELISLGQQPAELEEAVGEARMVKSREEEDMSVLEVASFCFSPPKRDRKLSDEEQQEEAKRPKSPAKEDVQLVEQHGSGGECGPQFRFGMTKEQTDQWANAMQQEYNDKYPVSLLGSAPAPTALEIRAPPACHCAPALW